MLKNILLFSLILLLFSCSNHKNVQVFIATEDLQIGTNRFSVAFADSNGLVNNESLEVSFSGEGGYPKFNKELGLKRANAVINYLVLNYNIDSTRFVAKTKGGEDPLSTINTIIHGEEGGGVVNSLAEINRRVDFEIAD